MENILILGGAGYTGSALTHLLVSKKYNVTVVDNFLLKKMFLTHYLSLKILM